MTRKGIVQLPWKTLDELMHLPSSVSIKYVYTDYGRLTIHLEGDETSGLPEAGEDWPTPVVNVEVERSETCIAFKRFVY